MKIEHLKQATALIEERANLIELVRHTHRVYKGLQGLPNGNSCDDVKRKLGLEFAVEIGDVRLQADWLDRSFQGSFRQVADCSIESALKILEVILEDFLRKIKNVEEHLSTLGVGSYDENYDFVNDEIKYASCHAPSA